jgi:O-antigen/teichoic acid export membrane protein
MTSEAITKEKVKEAPKLFNHLNGISLKARCTRGGIALTIGTVLGRGLQLVRYMVLARLLMPEELGLMAIVLAATSAFEAAFQVGIRQSVIQNKKGAETEYLNAAWWFQTIRGLVLFIVAFLAAPLVSKFYDNPELLLLMRVTLLAVVFRSIISPRAHVLEKEFQFHKSVLLTQISSILGTLWTIALVFILHNIWALVIGYVCEAFFYFFLSFILCPFLPRFSIDRNSLNKIMRFAYGMFGLPILTIVASQTDVIVLGKLLPMAVVGVYSLALRLATTPQDLYLRIFAPVLLSAFSEKQDDKPCLCRAILKMTKVTAMFGLPLAVFCVVSAGKILTIVFKSEYATAAVPFGILSIGALLLIQGITLASIHLAIGQPHLYRRIVFHRAAILVCLIYPAITFFGMTGAAMATLLAGFAALFAQIISMRKQIGLRLLQYLLCWLPGLALALIVLIPVTLFKLFGPSLIKENIVINGILCLLSYGIGAMFLFRGRLRNFKLNYKSPKEYIDID